MTRLFSRGTNFENIFHPGLQIIYLLNFGSTFWLISDKNTLHTLHPKTSISSKSTLKASKYVVFKKMVKSTSRCGGLLKFWFWRRFSPLRCQGTSVLLNGTFELWNNIFTLSHWFWVHLQLTTHCCSDISLSSHLMILDLKYWSNLCFWKLSTILFPNHWIF